MPTDHRAALAKIKRFDQLIAYLRDEMGWPIARDSFEEVDDLFYDFTADELGIDPKTAAKIQEIKRLRPLSPKQPWGIFFVKFEPKKLPVVALRRILSQVALKKRTSANSAERAAWAADDLLFISNYGEGDERTITFAHFSQDESKRDLPVLKVLGWNDGDTALHLDGVASELTSKLAWPVEEGNIQGWRAQWSSAFTLRHGEAIATSRDLSIRLAALARTIRGRISRALSIETDQGPLTMVMRAFKETLVHDLDADGFADMYAQTIAYGLLSARITNPKSRTADGLTLTIPVTSPFLKELMETFLHAGGRQGKAGSRSAGHGIDFDELGVNDVVELLDDPDTNMMAVVSDFGDRNRDEDPIIHFYELFLKEYDAEKRTQRGVFYTPRPIVSQMVRSVDERLRSEFHLEDGLADITSAGTLAKRHPELAIPVGLDPDRAFVQILDPATGTGTFLVEVIDLIYRRMSAKWRSQRHGAVQVETLWNEYVPKHLLPRLHGFELMMAPYAIAHLNIGRKLYETGYRFSNPERARIYLTNTLEQPHDLSGRFEFAIPALAHEAKAVNEVKEAGRFSVVIGNPPYLGHSRFSLMQMAERFPALLVGSRTAARAQEAQIRDDYAWFFGAAEYYLRPRGLLSLVTSDTFTRLPSYRYFRADMLRHFRVASLLALGPYVFSDVYRIHFTIVTLTKRDMPLATPDEAGSFSFFDLAALADGASQSELGGPSDPRLRHLDSAAREGDGHVEWGGVTSIVSRPTSKRDFVFLPIGKADAELRSRFQHEAVPLFAKGGTGCIVRKKWPGITTTFDDLFFDNDRAALERRIGEFFSLCTETLRLSPQKRGDRLRGFRSTEIANRERLASAVQLAQQYSLAFDRTCIKRSVAGTLAEGAMWYPPADNCGWLYYEPRFRFERSTPAEGKQVGWGSQSQWRDPGSHSIALKLIYTTSTNPSGKASHGYRAFVVDDEWYVRKGGATSQQYNYTGIDIPEEVVGLGMFDGHNNLTSQGTAMLAALEQAGGNADDLLFYVAAVYNSEAAAQFHSVAGGEGLGIKDITAANAQECLGIARRGRILRDLHRLRHHRASLPDGRAHPQSRLDQLVHEAACQRLGISQKTHRGTTVHLPHGFWQHVESVIVEEQAQIDLLVEALYEESEPDLNILGTGGPVTSDQALPVSVLPFRPRTLEATPDERYKTCVPLVPLKAAAGAFGDPQHIEEDGYEWVEVGSRHRLRPGMFVAQVVGKSMEPAIPDGAYCLFAAPVEGTRQGKTVLVQLRDATDPENGERYTVKRYESAKVKVGDSWQHERITLKPVNPDFKPIVLDGADEGTLQVIAEFVEVLGGGS